MKQNEDIKTLQARLDMKIKWDKHLLQMKIIKENHELNLESKRISNQAKVSKEKRNFWFSVITFLNALIGLIFLILSKI